MTRVHQELMSWEAWSEASDARREEIAKEVETWSKGVFRFEGLESYRDGAPSIAVFVHARTGLPFSMVPGGSGQVGFSEPEEELVSQAMDIHEHGEIYEMFQSLLDNADMMRPVHRVEVGPLLVLQEPLVDIPYDEGDDAFLDALAEWLFEDEDDMELVPNLQECWAPLGLRLPREHEWEYAARGGKDGELTYQGDIFPGEEYVERLLDEESDDIPRNDFGLGAMGAFPEVCLDAWRPDYDTPREDAGLEELPVMRGGAASIYPWENEGEWHMLLNAYRHSDEEFSSSLAFRPVADIGAWLEA